MDSRLSPRPERNNAITAVIITPPGYEPGIYAVAGARPPDEADECFVLLVNTWGERRAATVAPAEKPSKDAVMLENMLDVGGVAVQSALTWLVERLWGSLGTMLWAAHDTGRFGMVAAAWCGSRPVAVVNRCVCEPIEDEDLVVVEAGHA